MDAMTAAITAQFSKQMAAEMAAQATASEERFRSLEGYRVVTSEPEVTIERVLQDVGSPTPIIL
ncbi:hypothetical protein FH972_017769 [Carpinus fangiana]|uniref:Uncharacterized protein n=1 Tax=Carpinus fangiana TaxID=176857 RepID=A0A5N6Q928_9ROSI|nr:hypothetical protein FH972_027330 [Carpinus fangiana]KAE8099816.1 hypothetical protein FH972_017769 [Carpinus fangiana]